MHIKRIALCFYGQWRTGTHCINTYRKLLNCVKDQVEINVFFSLKSNTDEQEEIAELIHSTFDDIVSSVTIHFLNDPVDIDNRLDTDAIKTIYGIIDTIIMKQHYESTHDTYHDAVFLLRPDVVLNPEKLFKYAIDLLTSSDDIRIWGNSPDSLICTMYNQSLNEDTFEPLSIISNQITDQFIIYTGTAIDRFCYESMLILKTHSEFFKISPIHMGEILSLHTIHTKIAKRLSITILQLPKLLDDGFEPLLHMDSVGNGGIYDIHRLTVRPLPIMNYDFSKTSDINSYIETCYNLEISQSKAE